MLHRAGPVVALRPGQGVSGHGREPPDHNADAYTVQHAPRGNDSERWTRVRRQQEQLAGANPVSPQLPRVSRSRVGLWAGRVVLSLTWSQMRSAVVLVKMHTLPAASDRTTTALGVVCPAV